MTQAVSCWPLTVDAQVQHQASPHAILSEQIGTGTDFSLDTSLFPITVSPSMFHPHFSVTDAIILVTDSTIK